MSSRNGLWIFGTGVAMIMTLGGLAYLYLQSQRTETLLGILMAIVVVVLMVVLFFMAIGFSRLGLTDSQQALGLPEGSIRAMIALFLIMVFISFGLYLYRTVAGFSAYTLQCLTNSQVDAVGNEIISKYPDEACKGSNSPYYDVAISQAPNKDGVDLAKQLMTTVATLVVSISSFYFGSRAAQLSRGTTKPDQPRISSVSPPTANRQQVLHPPDPKNGFELTIMGDGLLTSEKVKLVQEKNQTEKTADEITSNDSKIIATFRFIDVELDKAFGEQQDAKFNLVVINKDGRQEEKPEAFTITSAPSTDSPAPTTITLPAKQSRQRGKS